MYPLYADLDTHSIDVNIDFYNVIWSKFRESNQDSQAQASNSPEVESKKAVVDACSYCNTITSSLRKCSGCHKVKYCNKDCQHKHWIMHKFECDHTSKFSSERVKNSEDVRKSTEFKVDENKCSYCSSSDTMLRRCTACYKVRYCSEDCQKKHWSRHKRECIRKTEDGKELTKQSNLNPNMSEEVSIVTCSYCSSTSAGKLMKCSRCHKVSYCDKECQLKHWASHKKECTQRVSIKSLSSMSTCNGCNKEFPNKSLRKCTGCHSVAYCGIDCQKKDWLTQHKSECTSRSVPILM